MLPNKAGEVSGAAEHIDAGDVVHLWLADFREFSGALNLYCQTLSHDELKRAERFKFDSLRNFYVFCRGTLRHILSQYTGIDAKSLQFHYGEKGKPSLPPEFEIRFNVSHSGSLFVCAVSKNLDLGVDVEEIRSMNDMTAIAQDFFAPSEQRNLARIAEVNRTQSFYECWTRKEAVIKATGEGVSRMLDTFEVAFGPGVVARLVRFNDETSPIWNMESFVPRPGYVGALTSPTPWSSLRVYEFHQSEVFSKQKSPTASGSVVGGGSK